MKDYFDYPSPIALELKRLGYALDVVPSDQDILLMDIIFNDDYNDISGDMAILNKYQIRDCTKAMLRVYAYYMNNPQQFNYDPRNIVGHAIRHAFNTAISFLSCIYKKKYNSVVKVRKMLIRKYEDRVLTILYTSSKQLAERVKHNTYLERNPDLNINDRLNFDLFR